MLSKTQLQDLDAAYVLYARGQDDGDFNEFEDSKECSPNNSPCTLISRILFRFLEAGWINGVLERIDLLAPPEMLALHCRLLDEFPNYMAFDAIHDENQKIINAERDWNKKAKLKIRVAKTVWLRTPRVGLQMMSSIPISHSTIGDLIAFYSIVPGRPRLRKLTKLAKAYLQSNPFPGSDTEYADLTDALINGLRVLGDWEELIDMSLKNSSLSVYAQTNALLRASDLLSRNTLNAEYAQLEIETLSKCEEIAMQDLSQTSFLAGSIASQHLLSDRPEHAKRWVLKVFRSANDHGIRAYILYDYLNYCQSDAERQWGLRKAKAVLKDVESSADGFNACLIEFIHLASAMSDRKLAEKIVSLLDGNWRGAYAYYFMSQLEFE